MNRRAFLSTVTVPLGVRLARAGSGAVQTDDGWTPLFNERDLASWDTWLGKPYGLNTDPRNVFSVVDTDGARAVRISGEVYGALTTRLEFENYHLRFEFKWGERRWPPREQALRDSGCCYHGVGPHGASYGFWLQSFEFQVQEGDCGDFYPLAGVIADVEAVPKDAADPRSELVYRKGTRTIIGHTKRVIKDGNHEKPHGSWNRMDLYCVGPASAHVVNGTACMVLTGLRRRLDGVEVPLTKGRIQFQSEGAEVFYRNMAIRHLEKMPPSVLTM